VLYSLVLVPYTVYVNRSEGRLPRLYAATTLAQTGVLAGASVAVVVVWATFLASGVVQAEVSTVIWSLAAVLPFVMLREFARRLEFAGRLTHDCRRHHRIGRAGRIGSG